MKALGAQLAAEMVNGWCAQRTLGLTLKKEETARRPTRSVLGRFSYKGGNSGAKSTAGVTALGRGQAV